MRINKTKLTTALDLFAGSGGFSCGARLAGLRVLQAVEVNAHAVMTYTRNNPGVDIVDSDIRSLDPLTCLRRLGLAPGAVDVIVAGPPCQGFSDSNRRTRSLDNPNNHLYKEVLRFCKAIQPTYLVIENVAGLRTLAGGVVLQSIVDGCRELGYEVDWKILCAADYGVPQFRNRIFIVASRSTSRISFPEPSHGPNRRQGHVIVREGIADLPVLRNGAAVDYRPYRRDVQLTSFQVLLRGDRGCTKQVQGNLVTRSSELILRRYAKIGSGENWEAIPRSLLRNYRDATRCHTGIYHRLCWDRPAKVLGNFRKNMLIHPSQNRGLSVREAARLQSFPDAYEFVGSIGFQQQQVADAVPPLLAMAVVKHMMHIHLSSEQQQSRQLEGMAHG